MKRIVLTGGGTAGHVSPNQALIPLLQEEGWEIHYIGTKTGIERTLIEPMQGVTYHAVSSGKLRRYFDLKNFTDPFRVIAGAFQSMALIHRLKPNVVFSKGGFVSVPVVFGAALCLICDLVARVAFAPFELPVGIVLSIVGAPFFLYLLLIRKKRSRHDAT